MSDTICLKTGCQLAYDGGFYWGDLHQHSSGALIFNAVLNGQGEAMRLDDRENAMTLAAAVPDVWERRGVFVLRAARCQFDAALLEHIGVASRGFR